MPALMGLSVALPLIYGLDHEPIENYLENLVEGMEQRIRSNGYGNTENGNGFWLTPYGAVPQSWFYQEDNL